MIPSQYDQQFYIKHGSIVNVLISSAERLDIQDYSTASSIWDDHK